ncbi:hypothetical protein W97_05576 [Coniosporium apollinis CBS 100218]|uniref:Epoxide hydrolase N-terminal domain-containing protein n=1 Tax=Coniosporium apollinis (strain CBS 100218) TaxID=1168221 RepID=R7YXA2_CONA1|nr:uncharacterized protein W97_05576 [Coniosporium apollinis CBS 100218]EON66478.1 hypothetical protein W97_05576 [Coniosporium apollinis CBS 100218]
MAASQFLYAPYLDTLSDRPFSRVPEDARVKQELCEVRVPPHAITELKRLIQTARLGPETFNTKYGLTGLWMKEAVQAWTDVSTFNWAKVQDYINSVPHFKSEVDYQGHSYTVHYVALFSKRSDAIPVVNIHGWPGCLEVLPLMNLLQEKYTPDTLPYHFIAPSMPGYTFSSGPPNNHDFSTLDTSRIFRILLHQLGFDDIPYIVVGGDIGSHVARALAVEDAACSAIHLNFCFDGNMHATRPATIGSILISDPIALLAGIGEKFAAWTNKTPTLNTILTFITVYWLTETFPRSIYRADFVSSDVVPSHGNPRWCIPDGKPFGFSAFSKEILPVPRAWIERTGKVTFWRKHKKGGRFAALEVPEVMLRDLEDFVAHATEARKPISKDDRK